MYGERVCERNYELCNRQCNSKRIRLRNEIELLSMFL
jgi:hypothetical protein